MWKEFYKPIIENHPYTKIKEPAGKEDIASLEKTLGVSIPDELTSFLLEMNGDGDCLMGVREIMEVNTDLRALDCYMSFECLLFFARNGCGDYYGYAITKDGYQNDNIFIWNHEDDSRMWCAKGLKDMIVKVYSDEI